ncbi:MAG: flagellar hook-associated protein FlgL [Colwellia sp.]|nr:flagellar hook-associated protein FlgL [Colwellia sp.]MCW8863865.1 flagellar hook-associated protein FlgL [Colwellia sp.]MCW9081147.1 flagellar hook-associated protein FlgL [Colwellia sp.]
MRVSTQQFYFQNAQQLSNKQTDVNDQVKYLSSGKRVLTAKDDAVSYGTLAGYKDGLANIEKYQRNLNQAENRNSLQEVSFASAEDVMQQLKQLFIQANNGTLSDDSIKSLAELAKNSQSQLLDVANTQDESGDYIFAGYQIDVQPFSLQPDDSVIYQGDGGIRELQIAKNVMVDINQSGDDAFEKVPNNVGDFAANYNANTSGILVNKAVIVNPGSYDSVTNPPDYNFNFTSSTDLTVTDANGAVVFNTNTYAPGQTVAFNGIEVQISGNPLPGDDFDLTPQAEISIFDTIKNAIDWMNVGVNPADPTQHSVDYDVILGQLDEALNHMTGRRAEAGVRLKLIENQVSNHLDSELYLSSGRSNIEDLDFAKAVATFEQSQVSLQAAQQSFVQIKNLSLFNYL